MTTATTEFLTTADLADRWGVSRGTLENWRGARRGPRYVKLGKGKGSPVLYRIEDVLEFERTHTIATEHR